jgi:hypothetical protein
VCCYAYTDLFNTDAVDYLSDLVAEGLLGRTALLDRPVIASMECEIVLKDAYLPASQYSTKQGQ